MDSLPVELLELVVDRCDYASHKALRSVCHQLHDLATAAVFEYIYIAPCTFEQALQNMIELVRSDRQLAKHVKSLVFDGDVLPCFDRHDLRARVSAEDQSDDAMDTAWRNYEYYRTLQTKWFYDNDRYLNVFKEVVSSLPNLTQAKVRTTTLKRQNSSARWPIWDRLKSHILVTPNAWCNRRIEDEDIEWNGDRDTRGDRDTKMAQASLAVTFLLEAIGFRSSFAGMAQLQTLTVQVRNSGRFKSVMNGWLSDDSTMIFSPKAEARFQTFLAAFTNLTEIDMEIPYPVPQKVYDLAPEEADAQLKLGGLEVTELLCRARGLRRLRLQYGVPPEMFCEPEEDIQHPLAPLFVMGSSSWPSLEHLDLSVNMLDSLLLRFLAILSPHLRSLVLKDMEVYDAQNLLAELPKTVRLERIRIAGLYTTINGRHATADGAATNCLMAEGLDTPRLYERRLEAYLLGKSGEFPNPNDPDSLYLASDDEDDADLQVDSGPRADPSFRFDDDTEAIPL